MEKDTAHIEIMTSLASIKQELVGVNDHLTVLNSKVATQEGKIGAMQIRDAKADGKREGSRTIIVAAWSVGSVILCSVGVVILEHMFK